MNVNAMQGNTHNEDAEMVSHTDHTESNILDPIPTSNQSEGDAHPDPDTEHHPDSDRPDASDQLQTDPLTEAQSKAKEYLDALQRLKAEFDNFRKRSEKERQRLSDIHQSMVIETLLPALDAFELAFDEHTKKSPEDFRNGMKLIYNEIMDKLKRMGLERLDLLHKPFKPDIADAMLTVPSDTVPPDHIVQVVTPGYLFRGTLLRAAKVLVSIPSDTMEETQSSREE